MKKQRVYRNIRIVILATLILVSCVVFLNNYVLPIKLKGYLQTSLTSALQKPVVLEKLYLNAFRGLIIIDNITVFEDKRQTEVFLQAKQLKFHPSIVPTLLKREVVLTSLVIERLNISLKRDKQGRLNILEMPIFKPKVKAKQKFSFSLANFKANNSAIILKDDFLGETQITVFENASAQASFSFPAKVRFNFNSGVKDKAKNVSCTGAYYFANKYLKLNLNCLELNLYKLAPYFKDKFPVSLTNDQTDIDVDIVLDSDKKLSIEGTACFNQTQARFNSLTLDGNLAIEVKGAYDLKNNTVAEAKGAITLKGNTLEGVSYVDKLEDLQGNISFTKEELLIGNLTGKTKGVPLNFAGYFRNPARPEFKLIVQSVLRLQEAIDQLPPNFSEKFKDIAITGNACVGVDFTGVLKDNWVLDFTGNAELKDAIIKVAKPAIEIKNIDSQLRFSKDALIIERLTMEFKDTSYSLTAAVNGFSQPLVSFNLAATGLSAAGKVKFAPPGALIENITGTYKDVDFALSGQASNLVEPILTIHANLSSDIEKLGNALPKFKEIIQRLKLSGAINSDFYFEGKIAEPLNGSAKIKCSSAQIRAADFKINEVNLSGHLQQNKLFIDELTGQLYAGSLRLNALTNLESLKRPQFQMSLNVSELDLSQLVQDTKLQNKDMKGRGVLKCSLEGWLNDLKSFIGSGSLSIKDGYIWQAPIFNKLSAFLNIPELKNAVFKKAFADYRIQNSQITTQNLTLLSDNVAMIASGALGFNRSLDFLIQTEFSEDFYEALINKGSKAPIFLEALSRYALTVKLTGSLEEPKFKLKPIAVQQILKDGILKGLEKIFEE